MPHPTPAVAELVLGAQEPAILIPDGQDEPVAWRLTEARLEVLGADGAIAALDLSGAALAQQALEQRQAVACVRIDDEGPVQDWTLTRRA